MRKTCSPQIDSYSICSSVQGLCEEYKSGYILERIADQQKSIVCFDGIMSICGLPRSLCQPLKLCNIEVRDILPQACMSAPSSDKKTVKLLVKCHVVDANGCKAEGMSSIEVNLPDRDICLKKGCTIRLGAKIDVLRAIFCAPCAVNAQLKISLMIVIGAGAMVFSKKKEEHCCHNMPLYPHLALPEGKCLRKMGRR